MCGLLLNHHIYFAINFWQTGSRRLVRPNQCLPSVINFNTKYNENKINIDLANLTNLYRMRIKAAVFRDLYFLKFLNGVAQVQTI